jgi:hypothetical protein
LIVSRLKATCRHRVSSKGGDAEVAPLQFNLIGDVAAHGVNAGERFAAGLLVVNAGGAPVRHAGSVQRGIFSDAKCGRFESSDDPGIMTEIVNLDANERGMFANIKAQAF